MLAPWNHGIRILNGMPFKLSQPDEVSELQVLSSISTHIRHCLLQILHSDWLLNRCLFVMVNVWEKRKQT